MNPQLQQFIAERCHLDQRATVKLKDFLDRRMLDHGNALIVVQEPIDHVWYGVDIDVAGSVALQWRLV